MTSKKYVELSGSHRLEPAATRIGDVAPDEPVEISVYLKPREIHAGSAKRRYARAEMDAHRAHLHEDDIRRLTDFAHDAGLTVLSVEPGRRLVRLLGPAAKVEAAFRTRLGHYQDGRRRFRGRSGALHAPEDIAPFVESVLGLDTRPAAQPRIAHVHAAKAMPGYLPNRIGELYGFPQGVTGAGQCIALIELGGGYLPADTKAAFKAMGLAPPQVLAVSVDGGVNKPTPDDGSDGEVALDIQVAGGVAPGAKIVVYFTPNTDAGFVDALSTAAHDATNKPGVISISWGSAESNWTAQAVQSMNSALQDAGSLGVSVFVAAGDNLATDSVSDGKAHVDFPASSPWAIGCGGTAIKVGGTSISAETVWNDGNSGTGGGISDLFGIPAFQQNAKLPPSVNGGRVGRGVPDVAADAAPGSGYTVVIHGRMSVVGGTSAVAPLWAGLTTLINEKAPHPVGFFLPTLYAQPALLRPVISGNNKPSGSTIGYSAGKGWNACTGLGVPKGQDLFNALTASLSMTSPAPVPTSSTTLSPSDPLGSIDHIVVLMLENRSFDHMLGFLYADNGNVSPAGHAFEGLTGKESNPGSSGGAVPVFRIDPGDANAYFMPGADPGEGYTATNSQLFGSNKAPTPPVATNQGFVRNYSYTLGWEAKEGWSILSGTTATDIMGIFTPEALPVLSGLAAGYAVCDHWYSSAPTETLPNRAFVCAGTSQGHMDDKTKKFTSPSIFGELSKAGITWAIYGYDTDPLTRLNFPDTTSAADSHFGLFADFKTAAGNGTLPAFTFLEPSWDAAGNSQHPNYDVALGEQLIHDVYYALRKGPAWNQTLLIITYDEHGGCYDHVAPPSGAVPPDNSAGEFGFDFTRFGVRVPAVLVSPLIAPGTVFRVPAGGTPLDHTSILKTVERRWNLQPLTQRDAAAPDVGAVLSLDKPRTDDPLAGVVVPVSGKPGPSSKQPSHLQQVHAELVSQLPVPDKKGGTHHVMPELLTNADYKRYIRKRTADWKASRKD